jgi:iron complex transport system ATP-binding protein
MSSSVIANEVVHLENLSVRRGGTLIIDRLDWRIRRGEHWVLMGANGSGKTSLLSVLAGYLTPSEGLVRVCGHTYGEYPWQELRAKLGIVSSSVKRMMQPGFCALEIVASGDGAIVNPWEAFADAVLKRAGGLMRDAGIAEIAGRDWELLSQGERQRVLICRSLMADPHLLILDEPCSGLDPVARAHFLGFVETTASAPSAPPLVLVTHHVEEITPAFTHALILRKGRVVASGPIRDALNEATLSEAFDAPLRLNRDERGRYSLDLS